jgi:phosphatidylserine decarboxylase
LVGATIVGSMATTWHGIVNPPRSANIRKWSYDNQNITLKQGDEMGKFLLGSTVVMLFAKDSLSFNKAWHAEKSIKLGEVMGLKP